MSICGAQLRKHL